MRTRLVWAVLRQLLSALTFVLATSFVDQPAQAARPSSQIVLITGVGATRANSLDPAADENISSYRDNFAEIITLSYGEGGGEIQGPTAAAVDLSEAYLNVLGFLPNRVLGELLPIRDRQMDVLIAHSWGVAAVLEALRRGQIRRLPRQLVLVAPPQLTELGAASWRSIAQRYPSMDINIFIARGDILQRVREVRRHFPPNPDDQSFTEILGWFRAPGVKVQEYPTSPDPLAAHRLRPFLEYATAHNLFGLVRRDVRNPAADYLTSDLAFEAGGDERFFVGLRETTAQVALISERARLRKIELRQATDIERERMREAEQARWKYFVALLEAACAGVGPDGDAAGVLFSFTSLQDWASTSGAQLSKCGQSLLTQILAAGAPVSLPWIQSEARRYREESARDARRALRQARSAREARDNSIGTIGTSGNSIDRSANIPDIESTRSYRDARGILEGSRRWDY